MFKKERKVLFCKVLLHLPLDALVLFPGKCCAVLVNEIFSGEKQLTLPAYTHYKATKLSCQEGDF